MIRPFVLVAVLLAAGWSALSCANDMSYPETRKVEQTDNYHGTTVADPYRWLEDDNSAETKAWVQQQNALTNQHMGSIAMREAVRERFANLYNFEKFGLPQYAGKRYIWSHNDGLQQQSVIYMAPALRVKPQVALDPNTLSKDGTVALTGMTPSRDGRYLAYGIAVGGSDWQEWRVRDLDTLKDLPDVIKWVKFSSASWTHDGKGFFYSRYDAPKEGAALTGTNYYQKLYYHRLGDDQAKDVLVHQNPGEKEWGFGATVSDDGLFAFISVWKGSGRKNGMMVLSLPGGSFDGGSVKPIYLGFDAEYALVAASDQTVWLRTDRDAPRGRIIAIDLRNPAVADWKTVVPQSADALSTATGVGRQIFAHYLHDAASLVRVYDPKGKLVREIALPGVGTAAGFNGRWSHQETFFNFTNLTTPSEIYRFDIGTGKTNLFKRPQTRFDGSRFETRQEFVTSKDGTRVPIFIGYRKGLKRDGSNPTLLYGYGGFNVSLTPGFGVTPATWMDMGGVYVLANLRGGGEYGAAWHDAGTKLKKQNVFDDFIAVAEWLVANGYTKPSKLAINGGSNGGLLVGAVLNQRPELFGAAVPQVGVMDMLRYHKFTIGWAWVSDYGSSDNPDEFKALLAYSPLHTIRQGAKYPPVLVTTADHDDRVVPAHSFKYAATLQAANTGDAPKLIRIETSAGHGAGTPTSKIIEARSEILAFLAHHLGMTVQ